MIEVQIMQRYAGGVRNMECETAVALAIQSWESNWFK